jgi:hypothetical protein
VSRHKHQIKEHRIERYLPLAWARNKMVLTYENALVGFLCQIVSSLRGYGQEKVRFTCSALTGIKHKQQNPRHRELRGRQFLNTD